MANHWLARAIAVIFLCCPAAPSRAAANPPAPADLPYIIDSWGTEGKAGECLPKGEVISIIQSRDGYLWLGTLQGLVRFDGSRFTVFDEANTAGLRNNQIVHLFEDSKGQLWAGTKSAGIALIRPDGQVQNLELGRGRSGGQLVSACEDTNGVVWLNTLDGEVARCAGGKVEELNVRFRPVMADKSGLLWVGAETNLYALSTPATASAFVLNQTLPTGKIDFLLASADGGFWLLADGRVRKWKDDHFVRDLGLYPWRKPVFSACEDHDGNLIVGTQDEGLFWYDRQGGVLKISREQGLSHPTVLSLCMDREGNLWAGTDGGGLNRIKKKLFQVTRNSGNENITSVSDDGAGGIWFAIYGPGGLNHLRNGRLDKYDSQTVLLDYSNVRSVFVDRGGTVWAGTLFGGLFFLQGNFFQRFPGFEALGSVQAIYQNREGRMWIGTQRGLARLEDGLKIFTTRDGLGSDSVQAMAENTAGTLWIGTSQGGLNGYQNGKFTSFRKQAGGLPSDEITALYADNDGVLWVGTSSGLARFHQGQWKVYTTEAGLAGNGIAYVIEDNETNLWIGSNAGLMRVAKSALNAFAENKIKSVPCRVFSEADGLPTSECSQGSQPAACKSADGTMWFPTIKGLVSVRPSELKSNTNRPPVMIESVRVEDEEQITNRLHPGSSLAVTIPHGKEHLEIRYTSLNLSAPERARFRYRLEGYETAWTEAGSRRVAPFSELTPGSYRFQVIACNEDGVWNETGSMLAIVVQPAFWQTASFRVFSAAALLALIVGVVYFLSTQRLQHELAAMKQKEALEQERSRIARDLHDQLGANLTQVALLGEMAESDKDLPAEVEDHARQISQTARETSRALDEIVWAVNPSNDTLEGLVNYACKYAQDYLEIADIRYRLEVPPKVPDAPIAPEVRHNVFLAFKESVNNVVKHSQAKSARIRLSLDARTFTIEIEDDGRGVAATDEKKGRNGLRNMRRRMEDVGGAFLLGPASGKGTLVRLTAPLKPV